MMTRLFNGLWLGIFTVTLIGCQANNQQAQLDQVPPPMYEAALFEPVEVETRQPAPRPQYDAGARSHEPVVIQGAGTQYTIQRGDTFWSIALRHYGDGQRHVDIARANPDINPNRLPVGRTIILP